MRDPKDIMYGRLHNLEAITAEIRKCDGCSAPIQRATYFDGALRVELRSASVPLSRPCARNEITRGKEPCEKAPRGGSFVISQRCATHGVTYAYEITDKRIEGARKRWSPNHSFG